MAEPMSSNEIEDVLSSIRRLVAQDLKPGDRAKLAAVTDTAQKLVLAPEQRIEEASAKFATVRRPSRRAAFPPVESVLADVAAPPSPVYDTALAPAPSHDLPADFTLGDSFNQAGADARATALNDEWQEIETRAAQGDEASANYDLGDLYAKAPRDDMAINPDMRLFDVAPEAFSDQMHRADGAAGRADGAAPTYGADDWASNEPDNLDESETATQVQADPGQSLSGTIEPDPAWADAAEARVIAELAGDSGDEAAFHQANETFGESQHSPSPAQAMPEVLFDEDVLRAMVQAILREEMTGPMGERITRNIRKLVRAEVGRMLAAHELE